MAKKYKLTKESINYCGRTLYRIEALKDFANVKKGDKGGYVQSEDNLSQEGNCWISNNAKVFDDVKVYDNALVFDNAVVFGNAEVFGYAEVYGNAQVSDNAEICSDAEIKNSSDYIVFKNCWSSGRYFTWTRSNNMWKVGCFYGTSEELIKKAYEDSEISGREYERVVGYVESILQDTE